MEPGPYKEKSFKTVFEVVFSFALIGFMLILVTQKASIPSWNLHADVSNSAKLVSLLLVLFSGFLARFKIQAEVFLFGSLLFFLPFKHHFGSYFSHNFFLVELAFAVFLFVGLKCSFKAWSIGILVFFLLGTGYNFFNLVSSGVIFGDDLSVFFYRLTIFKQTGNYINYDPFWNGGRLTTDIIGTGLLFLAPLYKLLTALIDDFVAFNILVLSLYLCFGVATFAVCKVCGLSTQFSLIGAFLALVSSDHLFRWTFYFGTLGFLFSVLGALGFIAFVKSISRELKMVKFFGLAASGAIISCWPLGWIFAFPSLALLLSKAGTSVRVLVALLLSSLPSILVLGVWVFNYFNSSLKLDVSDYSTDLSVFKFFGKNLSLVNWLVLLVGVLGAKKDRLIFHSLVWSILVSYIFQALDVQGVEAGRFFVFSACLFSVLAALWLNDNVFKTSLFSQAILGGWFFVSALQGVCFFRNFSHLDFVVFRDAFIRRLNEMKDFKERIVFLDYTLHQLKGAHLAPLGYFARREFLANFPTHSNWNVRPLLDFRKEKKHLKYRLKLQNLRAATVATFKKSWLRQLRQDDSFQRAAVIFPFNFFSFNRQTNKNRAGDLSKKFSDFNKVSFSALRDGNFFLPYVYNKGLKVSGCDKIRELKGRILVQGCRKGPISIIFKSPL